MSNPTDPKIISAIADFCQRPSAAVSVLEKIGNKRHAQAQQTLKERLATYMASYPDQKAFEKLYYDNPPMQETPYPIITEHIDCEIIEPKQLPNSNV